MKKLFTLLLVLVMVVGIAGCQSEKPAPPVTPADSTDSPSPEQAVQISESPEAPQTASPDVAPTQEALAINEAVTIELLGVELKGVDYDAGRFSEQLFFRFRYTNHTDKNIRGFESVITFNDMFGKEILSITLDNTDTIPAMESIAEHDMYLELNQFMADHNKLKATDYGDIIFEYSVKTILFTDGKRMPDDYPQGIQTEAAVGDVAPRTEREETPSSGAFPGFYYNNTAITVMLGDARKDIEIALGSEAANDVAGFYCDDSIFVIYVDERASLISVMGQDLKTRGGIGVGSTEQEAEEYFDEKFIDSTLTCYFGKDNNKVTSENPSKEYMFLLQLEDGKVKTIGVARTD